MTEDGPLVAMLVRNRFTNDTRVEKEARTLLAAGYRVTVVADGGDGLPAREGRDGIDVRRVSRSGTRLAGARYARHERRLAGLLTSLRPTVLHAHDSNALLSVAVAARRLGVPFVYDAHDLWLGRPRRDRSRAYFAASQLLYGAIERALVPRAAATITVSPPLADHLALRYGLRRVALVPNYPEFDDGARMLDLRALEGVDPAAPIVLYLGGLMAGRGLEQLVDAVALVPEVQLVLLGDGALAPALRQRSADRAISQRVHVLPPVPPDEVVAWARSADIGVSPIVPSCLNYRYSLPNKLFQYMAAGLPVVASDLPQVREVVTDARCGMVVDTRRPEAMASAIGQLLADPAAGDLGRRGAEAVRDRYHWGVAGQRLLDLYADLVPDRSHVYHPP
ncbi:MAG: glycosyltransferase family 4 protein [Chloroflexi bacterium]|nr:glycosyltransferase family 4 protein [Chloroflexota bacterium]